MKTIKEIALEIASCPQTIAIIADANQGKSMLNYNFIEILSKEFNFNLFTFGLRKQIKNATMIGTVKEMEEARRVFLNIDEFDNLFDLEDRHEKKNIEKTLRLINHNNNILNLIGLPRNFNKFISASVNKFIFLSCTHDDFINGSTAKRIIKNYKGYENGSTRLSLNLGEALYYDGKHYHKFNFNYLEEYDTKKDNKPVFEKRTIKNVGDFVAKNVEKACIVKNVGEVKNGNV